MNLTLCTEMGLAEMAYISLSPRVTVTLAVLMSVIDVFTIVANLTVITSMTRSHVRRRRNPRQEFNSNHITKLLIGSTAVANIFVGVIVMPLGIFETVNKGKWTLGGHLCRARLTVIMILCTVSSYHVMCLSLDRYMSICKPLKYRLLTTKIGRCIVLACWVLPGIFLTGPSTAGWHLIGVEETAECNDLKKICSVVYNTTSFVLLIVTALYFPSIVSFILYALVLVEVRNFNKRKTKYQRHERQESMSIFYIHDISAEALHSETQAFEILDEVSGRSHLTAIASNSISEDPQSGKFQTEANFASSQKSSACASAELQQISNGNRRAICTMGSIVVCYTVCWLPLWICSMMAVLLSRELPFWVFVLIVWFASSHAAVSPVLLCLNRSIRRAVKSFLCRKNE